MWGTIPHPISKWRSLFHNVLFNCHVRSQHYWSSSITAPSVWAYAVFPGIYTKRVCFVKCLSFKVSEWVSWKTVGTYAILYTMLAGAGFLGQRGKFRGRARARGEKRRVGSSPLYACFPRALYNNQPKNNRRLTRTVQKRLSCTWKEKIYWFLPGNLCSSKFLHLTPRKGSKGYPAKLFLHFCLLFLFFQTSSGHQ